jgi:hypothetical protein
MPWIPFNANPAGRQVGDCTIRAISKATEKPWEDTYSEIAVQGLMMRDMPSANAVWGAYLRSQGFKRHIIPNTCPDCYTLNDFCEDHPEGMYIVALQNHVVAVNDGNYFDTWDSGEEMPLYYFSKEE